MKIAVINGSPKGKSGATNVMVTAFLKGAQAVGAEVLSIFLAEKEVQHCRGCHVCWTRGPAQCTTDDDMFGVLSQMAGASVIAFATPVYFGNISGMLKVFMDRMTMVGSPHAQADSRQYGQEPGSSAVQVPKLMMISSCGLSDRSEFDVISLWIRKVAQKMQMDVIGELYATQGKRLLSPSVEPEVASYLLLLQEAGKEIAAGQRLSEVTRERLLQGL